MLKNATNCTILQKTVYSWGMEKKESHTSLLELFLTFAKIGAVTFGGGYAMLPILERELSDKKKWTTSDDLLDYYAISQVTPGVIAVNVSTFIGNKLRGAIGGIVATLGVVTPSILIITLIALCISNFSDIVWVQKALRGINISVAALLTYSVFNFAKKAVKGALPLFFLLLAFIAVYFFNVGSVIVIVIGAILGIVITHFNARLLGGKNA